MNLELTFATTQPLTHINLHAYPQVFLVCICVYAWVYVLGVSGGGKG